jgi:hypothetical protein
MTAAVAETTDQRRHPWAGLENWGRLALVVGWVLLVAVAFVVGERPSTLRDLEQAVAAGEVHEVRITRGLGAQETGVVPVQVHWRNGMLGYTTEVIEARPRNEAPRRSERGDATAVIGGDLGTRLQAAQPGLEVVRVAPTSWSTTLLGWQLPGSAGLGVLALMVATLMVLAGSPEPWRATRWAWFWLMLVAAPVGVPAYLLLAGPLPLVPAPRTPARRLTGGWAFLLALVLSSAADATW